MIYIYVIYLAHGWLGRYMPSISTALCHPIRQLDSLSKLSTAKLRACPYLMVHNLANPSHFQKFKLISPLVTVSHSTLKIGQLQNCRWYRSSMVLCWQCLFFLLSGRSVLVLFELDLRNSNVWWMQCFCSVVSKMVSEHDRRVCSETSLESNTACIAQTSELPRSTVHCLIEYFFIIIIE